MSTRASPPPTPSWHGFSPLLAFLVVTIFLSPSRSHQMESWERVMFLMHALPCLCSLLCVTHHSVCFVSFCTHTHTLTPEQPERRPTTQKSYNEHDDGKQKHQVVLDSMLLFSSRLGLSLTIGSPFQFVSHRSTQVRHHW